MNLRQGTLLKHGEYRIECELGHGGFGVTYLAVQVGLNRRVAIKEFFMSEYCNRDAETSHVTVPSEGSKELVAKFRNKFIKEAQNIAGLKHPHIISIYDVFEDNGTAYYVMEYLDHGSLADVVKHQGRLPEADALRYIRQIADALRYIHARKMNHLDVKPGNILIDEEDHAVLIDFGLSKRYDDEGNQTSTTPVGISHGYAPLEQYKKGGVGTFSPATDIYSLGATLYKLITGTTPPDVNDILTDGLPTHPGIISPAVFMAIEQAMQPNKNKRPQTIEEFLALFDASAANASVKESASVSTEKEAAGIDNEETRLDIEHADSPTEDASDKAQPAAKPRKKAQRSPVRGRSKFATLKRRVRHFFIRHKRLWIWTIILSLAGALSLGIWVWYMDYGYPKSVSCTIPGEAVDLGLSVKWADRNIGASSPSDYGDFFSYNETTPKSTYTIKSYSFFNNYGEPAYHNWGSGWDSPGVKEWEELVKKCKWTKTTQDGHNGYRVTGPNGNSIFLPFAGYRNNIVHQGKGEYDCYRAGYEYISVDPEQKTLKKYFSSSLGVSVRPVQRK